MTMITTAVTISIPIITSTTNYYAIRSAGKDLKNQAEEALCFC